MPWCAYDLLQKSFELPPQKRKELGEVITKLCELEYTHVPIEQVHGLLRRLIRFREIIHK
jgi:hypothetical protein